MGRQLGHAVRRRLDAGAPWPLLPASECIRAALGARNSVSSATPAPSQSRRCAARSQVLRPPFCRRTDDRPRTARLRSRPFHRFDLVEGGPKWRWRCAGRTRKSHERIFAFAQGIVRGWRNSSQENAALRHARQRWHGRLARSCAKNSTCGANPLHRRGRAVGFDYIDPAASGCPR